MVQKNVSIARTRKFPMIKEALALDIFFGIIYIIVPKLIATILTTVRILD